MDNTHNTPPPNQPKVSDTDVTNHQVTEFAVDANFANLTPEKLSANYPWMLLIRTQRMLLIVWMPLILLAFFKVGALPSVVQNHLTEGLWLGLGLWILWSFYVWLSAHYEGYAVRERDISFYSGVVHREMIIQPLTRLQHIEISRSLLERLFDLATLKLYSAGGSSHAIAIAGLTHTQAEALRHFILQNQALSDDS